MTFNAQQTQTWSAASMDRLRAELLRGYQRIEQTLAPDFDHGTLMTQTMLDGAQLAVEQAQPTWMSTSTVATVSAMLESPAQTDALIAGGRLGFLVFEEPITLTTLGEAEPDGVAPMDGLVWWAAEFDGHSFRQDSDEPNIVVVHGLSTRVSSEAPWGPSVWEDSELTDLGMFPLPLGMEMTPPTAKQDDLAPAIQLLFAYGQAIEAGRVLFADVDGGSPRRPTPREVAVVLTDEE
ncbi:hypothetical protein [Gordonia phthalatica]|nr:hypothetical protein [Gordonia phthalatica]